MKKNTRVILFYVLLKIICSIMMIVSALLQWFNIPFTQEYYQKIYGFRKVFLWGEILFLEFEDGGFVKEWNGIDKLVYIFLLVLAVSILICLRTCIKYMRLKKRSITYEVYFKDENIIHLILLIFLLWFSFFICDYSGYLEVCKELQGDTSIGFGLLFISVGLLILVEIAEYIYKYIQIENIEVWDE